MAPPDSRVRDRPAETLEPGAPGDPAAWKTAEYERAGGLALIGAAEGYARRTTGQPGGGGVTVAVLDNGVGRHPDLADWREYTLPDTRTPKDHGTPVAGVVAARRDGRGIHGVAYNANLVSLATCKLDDACPGDRADVSEADEVAVGIASAAGLARSYGNARSNPEASSHVMNMSFNLPNLHDVPQITSAMREAADAGRVMVAALGNCGDGGSGCVSNGGLDDGIGPAGAPAANMADPGIAGLAIAVGSLNEAGTGRAGHSNTCGPVARYCLFAPGESVYTTQGGGGYARVDGTSFAAPHVAGAAAVVWGAFPNKRGDQIVDRLLTTARPLDGQAVSPVYGRGALDLGAAMNPVGLLSLSVKGSGRVPLAESFVDLPPGFGAPSGLAGAVVYDEQTFPFLTDLATAFRVHKALPPDDGVLRRLLSSLDASASISPLGRGVALEFAHGADELFPDRHRRIRSREEEVRDYRLHFRPLPGLTATVGRGGALGSSNGFVARRMGRAVLRDGLSVAPFAAFAGRGPDVSLGWRLDGGTEVDFAGRQGRGYFGSARAWLGSAGLTRRLGKRLTIGTRYGRLRESGSSMGLRTAGAFGSIADATTDFLDVSVEGRVSDDLSLFGSFSRGTARDGLHGGHGSLVSGWSRTRADSFVLGGELRALWRTSDRLILAASSPLRVGHATVQVNVPDREVADGVVRYTRRTADLSPPGRERRLQLVYEIGSEGGVSVTAGGYVRIEPDHDDSAAPELGAAAAMRLRF